MWAGKDMGGEGYGREKICIRWGALCEGMYIPDFCFCYVYTISTTLQHPQYKPERVGDIRYVYMHAWFFEYYFQSRNMPYPQISLVLACLVLVYIYMKYLEVLPICSRAS